jgi:Mn-dependent DtxR family transcriptional regulator
MKIMYRQEELIKNSIVLRHVVLGLIHHSNLAEGLGVKSSTTSDMHRLLGEKGVVFIE